MSALECPREHDVVGLVLSRRWPDGCDEELRAHAAACDVCREAAMVASLLQEDARALRAEIHVPSAGQVWWRAAIRARVEAVQSAERPSTWLHGLVAAGALGALVTVLTVAWPTVSRAAAWVAGQSWSVAPSTAETAELMMSTLQRSMPMVWVAAAFVILAPIAIYFAVSDE